MHGLLPHVIVIAFGVVAVLLDEAVSENKFEKFDVVVNLPRLKQGTELVLLSNDRRRGKNYHLEDFFWTGSGDGSSEKEEPNEYDAKTQIPVLDASSKPLNQTISDDTKPKCIPNCEEPVTLQQTTPPENNFTLIEEDVDHQFWLVTVLKSDGKNPILSDLKDSLEKLYKTAFKRHQEQHLGIQGGRYRRQIADEEVVNVHIHNISKISSNGDQKIEVIYHVSVSGQPVIASTAANDMKLVSDNEVIQELGYLPVIKAEPYLKSSQPEYLTTAKNTWLFIGAALAILFILLLFATLLTLSLSKRKKSGLGSANRRQVFEHGNVVETGKSFVVAESDKRDYESEQRRLSPSYINYKDESAVNKTFRSTGSMTSRPNSSTNSTTSSDSSLDISPLMAIQKKRKIQNNKINVSRPKGAFGRPAPFDEAGKISTTSESDTTSNVSTRDSADTILAGATESGILSPKSYLSMPSVKSFPRSNVPESLNKILQPVSVLHLDLMDDNYEENVETPQKFLKRNSMSAMEDPGVIGPPVWELHRKAYRELGDKKDDSKFIGNAVQMRKRFHDLLDETFTLFGSRRESSADSGKMNALEGKSKSAASIKSNNLTDTRPRPKTSDSKRAQTSLEMSKPKGAWNSHTPSPLTRPVSAGILKKPRAPEIDVDQVLAEGILKPDDPAVALIATIKTELKKCSLPGSTTNLAE